MHVTFLNNTIELPNLPEVAWKVRRAMSNPEIGIREITTIVQNDPVISARLVQVANSQLYRGMHKIDSLRAAVVRIGLDSTQNLITMIAIKQLFRADTAFVKERLKTLYEHSTTVAALCEVVADKLSYLDPERATLCGLLHDIGVIPILNQVDKQAKIIDSAEQLEETTDNLRVHIGSWLLKQWNFDSEIINVIHQTRNWRRDTPGQADYCDIVNCALLLEPTIGGVATALPSIYDLPLGAKLAESGLVIVSHEDFVEEVGDKIESIRAMLG